MKVSGEKSWPAPFNDSPGRGDFLFPQYLGAYHPLPSPALDVSVPFLSLPSSPVHIPPHLNIMNFILELQNKEMNAKKIIAVKDSGFLGF